MKKLPKYLSTFALALVVWGAFLVPNAFAQTYPILLQQPNGNVEGTNTPAMTTTQNIYDIGKGNLVGQLNTAVGSASFKIHATLPTGSDWVGVQIEGYSDAFHTITTDVIQYEVRGSVVGSSVNGVVTATQNTCIVGDCIWTPDTYAVVTYYTSLTSNLAWYGIPASVAPFNLISTDYAGVTPYLVLRGVNQSLSPGDFPNSNPSGIATSTIDSYCDTNFGTSTSFIGEVGNAFAWAGCYVTTFLFVPSDGALQGFSDLVETSQGKIPFSYGYDIAGIFSSMSASSSQNFPTYTIPLGAIDFASSTAMGPIFPTSLDFLSSTTINKFLPPGMHDLLYNFAIFVIWVEVAFLLYRKIVPVKAKI